MWFIVEEQKNYMDQIDYGSNFEHICHIYQKIISHLNSL